MTEEGVFVERLFNGSGLIECLCNSSLGFFVSLCKYIKALACPSDVLIFLTSGSFVTKEKHLNMKRAARLLREQFRGGEQKTKVPFLIIGHFFLL